MKRKGLPIRELSVLFRQLADALHGGLSVKDAAAILVKAGGGAAAAPLQRWLEALENGAAMSEAMAVDPGLFPPETVTLVREAEEGSVVPDVLDLIAKDLEFRSELGTGMKGALAWPALAAAFMALIVALAMLFVIPVYRELFRSFGAELPALTMLLVAASDFFVAGWFWMLLAVLALVAYSRTRRLSATRVPWVDAATIRLPYLRDYLRHTFTIRLARIIELADRQRLGIAPAISYLRATTANRRLAAVADALEAQLRGGKEIAAALWDTSGIPRELAAATEIGVRSGNVALAMGRVIASSESEAARNLMRFHQLMLFTTYVAIGIVVGVVVIAMYLPIFKMGQAI